MHSRERWWIGMLGFKYAFLNGCQCHSIPCKWLCTENPRGQKAQGCTFFSIDIYRSHVTLKSHKSYRYHEFENVNCSIFILAYRTTSYLLWQNISICSKIAKNFGFNSHWRWRRCWPLLTLIGCCQDFNSSFLMAVAAKLWGNPDDWDADDEDADCCCNIDHSYFWLAQTLILHKSRWW